jgi:hypothetical protein
MKKLYLALALLVACNEEYEKISQEVIDGKVSHTERGTTGKFSTPPKIWVQTNISIKEVVIPYAYDGRWEVGDSCLLIIEKYREVQK